MLNFILGIIVGLMLAILALYVATKHAKDINELFMPNPTTSVNTASQTFIRPAQIIQRETPAERALKDE